MDNRELFDEVAGTYKREVTTFDPKRVETLHECFGPVLVDYYEWKREPEQFVPGTDLEKVVTEMKAHYKVTPEEWAEIEKWMADWYASEDGL